MQRVVATAKLHSLNNRLAAHSITLSLSLLLALRFLPLLALCSLSLSVSLSLSLSLSVFASFTMAENGVSVDDPYRENAQINIDFLQKDNRQLHKPLGEWTEDDRKCVSIYSVAHQYCFVMADDLKEIQGIVPFYQTAVARGDLGPLENCLRSLAHHEIDLRTSNKKQINKRTNNYVTKFQGEGGGKKQPRPLANFRKMEPAEQLAYSLVGKQYGIYGGFFHQLQMSFRDKVRGLDLELENLSNNGSTEEQIAKHRKTGVERIYLQIQMQFFDVNPSQVLHDWLDEADPKRAH